MAKFKWRKWNNILHRDIGYLVVGLTVIFAISGIAVNHVDSWNPNYKVERIQFEIKPYQAASAEDAAQYVLHHLNIEETPNSYFRPSPDEIDIFFDKQTISANLANGSGNREVVKERFLLRDFNFLHLNHAKKWWTWFSDLYALALIFLAISGMFVLKGKKGLSGRGKWLTGIGLSIPILFLIFYKYL